MQDDVIILETDHAEERIITFYVYPTTSASAPYVTAFVFVLILLLSRENLLQRMVPIFYPTDNKIFFIKPVAQISLSYENDEMLKEICQVVHEVFNS